MGRSDGTDGYTWQVSVVDKGNGGGKQETPDNYSIVICDGSGVVVFSSSGPLSGGKVRIR